MRTHTIGEVLNRLKDEFDDITISKIRFLEAEGLISPDRTESGYRKFTVEDIDRLRYVLRAQRDRYLPLKVIKDELERIDAGLPVEVSPPKPDADAVESLRRPGTDDDEDAPGAAPAPDAAAFLSSGPTDVQLTASELADATGLSTAELHALRDHGLIRGDATFDGDDLQAARAAAALMEAGLEARHLRMYRQFADRELALYEQLVTPLLRQRNPDARRRAQDQLEALAAAGGKLHGVLLGRELRDLLRS